MKNHVFVGLAVSLLLGIGGCLPLPHYQHDYPHIVGVITASELAREGLEVRLRHKGSDCATPDQETITDEEGRFAFEKSEEFFFFMMFGDRKDRWTLCVEGPNGREWRWSSEGSWGGPAALELTCHLGGEGESAQGQFAPLLCQARPNP